MVFLSRSQVIYSTPSPVSSVSCYSPQSEDDCSKEELDGNFNSREISSLTNGKGTNFPVHVPPKIVIVPSSICEEELEDDWSDCEAGGTSHAVVSSVCSECTEFNATSGFLVDYLQDWLTDCQLDIPRAGKAEPSDQFGELQKQIKTHSNRIVQIASNALHMTGVKRFLEHLSSHDECPPTAGTVTMSGMKPSLCNVLTAWRTLCFSSMEWQGKLQGALVTNPVFFCNIATIEGFIARAEGVLDEPIPSSSDPDCLTKYAKRYKALSMMMEGIASREKDVRSLKETAETLFVDPQAFQRGLVTSMSTMRRSYRFATPACDRAMERLIEAENCLQDLREIGEAYIQALLKTKVYDLRKKKSRDHSGLPRVISFVSKLGSFIGWRWGLRYLLKVVTEGVDSFRSILGACRRLIQE